MQRKHSNRRYLEALNQKVLIYDGAMGTSLQTQNLTADHFDGEKLNDRDQHLPRQPPEDGGIWLAGSRGRNLLRVQGDLLAAHALDIHNVFVVMGDPNAIGD